MSTFGTKQDQHIRSSVQHFDDVLARYIKLEGSLQTIEQTDKHVQDIKIPEIKNASPITTPKITVKMRIKPTAIITANDVDSTIEFIAEMLKRCIRLTFKS